MNTFIMICIGGIAFSSMMTFLFIIFYLNEIEDMVGTIKRHSDENFFIFTEIRNYLFDIRELKREKARKKYICSNERDLK